MSLALCVLGSGSLGNCSLVRVGRSVVMIDAGFGPRSIIKRLNGTGVAVDDIQAVLLTHLDRDHFNPSWASTMLKMGICIYLAQRHVGEFYAILDGHPSAPSGRQMHDAGLIHVFDGRPFPVQLDDEPPALIAQPVHLSHDRAGTIGYVLRRETQRLAYATDLGAVPQTLIDAMLDADLIAIESNYDHHLQVTSSRPAMLKQRVLSGHGHLSNDQAFDAIKTVFDRSQRLPAHVVLLHLSRQCNHPTVVKDRFAANTDIAARLRLSSQTQPTGWLRVPEAGFAPLPGEQLSMFE
jgi:phosphoribosyl 1,2-cyclic phosphodiesterase